MSHNRETVQVLCQQKIWADVQEMTTDPNSRRGGMRLSDASKTVILQAVKCTKVLLFFHFQGKISSISVLHCSPDAHCYFQLNICPVL